MTYEEFGNINKYYETEWKKIGHNKDGSMDFKVIFEAEDYNKDGLVSWNELYNAMMRANFDDKMMMMAYELAHKFGDDKGNLTFDQYMKMIKSYEATMKAKEAGKGRKRMEIHMEEHPDGRNKMVVIMEGAQKLAISAAAVASAALFSY